MMIAGFTENDRRITRSTKNKWDVRSTKSERKRSKTVDQANKDDDVNDDDDDDDDDSPTKTIRKNHNAMFWNKNDKNETTYDDDQ